MNANIKTIAAFGALVLAAAVPCGASAAKSGPVVLEAESFDEQGGWTLDSQFMETMGSPYLLAHGLGRPVADAKTGFSVDSAGVYEVWAKTMNWTAWWGGAAAGRFRILVDGKSLENEGGATGDAQWRWVKLGEVKLLAGGHSVALHDVTGFDGRCDKIAVVRSGAWNESLAEATPGAGAEAAAIEADIAVIGGGVAGICAAITSARGGLKTVLVQDRPVLGGNNSSEVRVHLGGRQNLGPYPRLGDVLAEIGPAKGGNAQAAAVYEDGRKLAAVKAEKNITLLLNTKATSVARKGDAIESVRAVDVRTGKAVLVKASYFVDATGDGTVGFLAGADYRMGRESREETGEASAPAKSDMMTMGSSIQWYAEKAKAGDEGTAFPAEPWMIALSDANATAAMRGDWDWETGIGRDPIAEAERIRDYGMLVVYSNWAHVKNSPKTRERFADCRLAWVASVAGRRESRRLMGDVVFSENDIDNETPFPDGTCVTSWSVDLHFPKYEKDTKYAGEPYRAATVHKKVKSCPIPYRSLYSRNISNLFMAGRDISVTHAALGTVRVMRTTGMTGEVAGMAATVCARHKCTPRDVYAKHFDELKAMMKKGAGLGRPQPAQTYNQGFTLGVSKKATLFAGELSAGGVEVNGKVETKCERRVFDDGVAVRYQLPAGPRRISRELTEWKLPEDATAWYQGDWRGLADYEAPYESSKVGDIGKGRILSLPITAKLRDGTYRMITEANVVDYTDLAVKYDGGGRFVAYYHADRDGFDQSGESVTPWRVMLVAKDIQTLYSSDIVRRLCPEAPAERAKAVRERFAKPGRCIWQWLPAGAPKFGEQKDWYDRTKALGYEYYLIDEGWRGWGDDTTRWKKLKECIDYGNSIGVKTFIWVHSNELATPQARRAYLAKTVAAGAVGIKIDFMPPPGFKVMKWYEETLADTFDAGLVVDFHGAVKPTGRERFWPHELAREAIRGHEYHITRYNRVLPFEHDTILPFCRLVQGHGDYTPMVFEKSQLIHFTWSRQLAQGIVYACPFLCFGDFPKNYQTNPAADLIRALPSVYDETRVLPGSEIGECVALARRKGDEWFIAVENGAKPRTLEITFDFIKTEMSFVSYGDAPDRLDAYETACGDIAPGGKLKAVMRQGGGFAARLVPRGNRRAR